MLVYKEGIYHEIDERRLDEFKDKGYKPVETDVLKATAPKPVDKMTVDELKAYATEKGIDLGDAEKKAEILSTIKEAEGGE